MLTQMSRKLEEEEEDVLVVERSYQKFFFQTRPKYWSSSPPAVCTLDVGIWCFVQGPRCSLPWLVLGGEVCDAVMAGLSVMVIENDKKATQLLAKFRSDPHAHSH